jgi:hypothetical protein
MGAAIALQAMTVTQHGGAARARGFHGHGFHVR